MGAHGGRAYLVRERRMVKKSLLISEGIVGTGQKKCLGREKSVTA